MWQSVERRSILNFESHGLLRQSLLSDKSNKYDINDSVEGEDIDHCCGTLEHV